MLDTVARALIFGRHWEPRPPSGVGGPSVSRPGVRWEGRGVCGAAAVGGVGGQCSSGVPTRLNGPPLPGLPAGDRDAGSSSSSSSSRDAGSGETLCSSLRRILKESRFSGGSSTATHPVEVHAVAPRRVAKAAVGATQQQPGERHGYPAARLSSCGELVALWSRLGRIFQESLQRRRSGNNSIPGWSSQSCGGGGCW